MKFFDTELPGVIRNVPEVLSVVYREAFDACQHNRMLAYSEWPEDDVLAPVPHRE